MADNIVGNMFGVDPNQLAMQRYQNIQAQNLQAAQLTPLQQATMNMQNAGAGAVMMGAKALGVQTPEERLAIIRQQAIAGVDQSDPNSLMMAAQKLQQDDPAGASQLVRAARELQVEKSKLLKEEATTAQSQAMAEKLLRPEKSKWISRDVPDPNDPTKIRAVIYNPDTGEEKYLGGSGQKFRAAAIAKEDKKVVEAAEGKKQVSSILDEMEKHYNDLDKMGAIPSTQRSTIENLKASALLTETGQKLGGAAGTEAQSKVNSIKQLKSSLVSAISKATGRTATQLNSNVELKFAMDQATEPKFGIETNKRQLDFLRKTYGLGEKSESGHPADIQDLLNKFGKK